MEYHNGAILDLDHCLFDTEAFWAATLDVLGPVYRLDAQRITAERFDRSPPGPGRMDTGHDYDTLPLLLLNGVPPAEAERLLIANLRSNQWLYPGAIELISGLRERGYLPTILTVGGEMQQIKITCVPGLD